MKVHRQNTVPIFQSYDVIIRIDSKEQEMKFIDALIRASNGNAMETHEQYQMFRDIKNSIIS